MNIKQSELALAGEATDVKVINMHCHKCPEQGTTDIITCKEVIAGQHGAAYMPCCKNIFFRLFKAPRGHVHSGKSMDTFAHREALLSLHIITHSFNHSARAYRAAVRISMYEACLECAVLYRVATPHEL